MKIGVARLDQKDEREGTEVQHGTKNRREGGNTSMSIFDANRLRKSL